MIAALPMYDRPETALANDRLWELIRNNLGYGPDDLTRSDDLWAIWQSPDLLMAQTCGYPYRSRLHDRVRLVGTPVYALDDCPPGYYYSVIITRMETTSIRELHLGRFACNDTLSQSGWVAPRLWADAKDITMGSLLVTGAHRASVQAVASGQADWAGIDVISWRMMRRYDDFTDNLRVLAKTPPTPGLPVITALSQDNKIIKNAFSTSIQQLNEGDRNALMLRGATFIEAKDYLSVPNPSTTETY